MVFESWRKLYNRYRFRSKSRAVGKLTNVEPSGMARGNVEDTLAAWEDEILKSEKETNSTLSEDVNIAV